MSEQKPQALSESFSLVAQSYLIWSEAEQQAAAETIQKRHDCLRQIARIIGEKPVTEFSKDDLLYLKRDLLRRKLSPSRQAGILYALKNLLLYCRGEERLQLQLEPEDITFP